MHIAGKLRSGKTFLPRGLCSPSSLPRFPAKVMFWRRLVLLALILVSWGCVYRFTNRHIKRPKGVSTIAVEAVYDTSRQVIPHEMLWSALQQAFARNGQLRLAPQSSADALVRAHVKRAEITPVGTPDRTNPEESDEDPEVFQGGDPPEPSEFRALPRSTTHASNEGVTLVVSVEVWNLRSGERLMSQDYTVSRTFRSLRPAEVTSTVNTFLRHEEAIGVAVESMAQSIAQQVVQGLMVL